MCADLDSFRYTVRMGQLHHTVGSTVIFCLFACLFVCLLEKISHHVTLAYVCVYLSLASSAGVTDMHHFKERKLSEKLSY